MPSSPDANDLISMMNAKSGLQRRENRETTIDIIFI